MCWGGPGDLEMSFHLEWLLRAQGGSEELPDSRSLEAAGKCDFVTARLLLALLASDL